MNTVQNKDMTGLARQSRKGGVKAAHALPGGQNFVRGGWCLGILLGQKTRKNPGAGLLGSGMINGGGAAAADTSADLAFKPSVLGDIQSGYVIAVC